MSEVKQIKTDNIIQRFFTKFKISIALNILFLLFDGFLEMFNWVPIEGVIFLAIGAFRFISIIRWTLWFCNYYINIFMKPRAEVKTAVKFPAAFIALFAALFFVLQSFIIQWSLLSYFLAGYKHDTYVSPDGTKLVVMAYGFNELSYCVYPIKYGFFYQRNNELLYDWETYEMEMRKNE